MSHVSLLEKLSLPARFEPLVEKVGADVASLLVPPDKETSDSLAKLVEAVRLQAEGVFVPLSGRSGAGKTTFASSVTQWQPQFFAHSVVYDGQITFDDLVAAVQTARGELPANERRATAVVIDHRESNPPTKEEMSAIKRFTRTSTFSAPTVVFWPETSQKTANEIASNFIEIAGEQPISLPLEVNGPNRDTWQDIAKNTLRLVNEIEDLSQLGVNPDDYDVAEFHTIGDFLRKISRDFNDQIFALRAELEKPVEMVVLFASESSNSGVLSQLVSNSVVGLLDAGALLSSTPDSVIGRWWKSRRGLLTRTIVQLNARAFCLPPVAAISALRNCSDANDEFLSTLQIPRVGGSRAVRDLERCDVGKFLAGLPMSRNEAQGTPATASVEAFKALAANGLNGAKDKKYNKIIGEAFSRLLEKHQRDVLSVSAEKKLEFAPLIPDLSIDLPEYIQCVEFAWRQGDFLSTKRSVVAAYILEKLRNYARELGWSPD